MRGLLFVLVLLLGCSFSPDIGDGTIQCAHDHSCPPGFICGSGERCFRSEPQTVDGGTLIDAAPDACKKHCMGN
jgi:hypothetical protein